MKKYCITLLLGCLAALGAITADAATASTFNILCINRIDGVKERLMLHKELDLQIGENGVILLVHPELTVELPTDVVADFTFENDDNATETYTGDHLSAIETPELPDHGLIVTPHGLTSASPIAVYDLKGVQVASAKPENGIAALSLSALPSGIYIVKSGTSTLKIKL